MQGKNVPAIALCGAAALFILIGIFTTGWASRSRRGAKISVGTSEVKSCWRGECRTQKFDPDRMRRGEDKLVYLGGKAVFSWGIINVLLLIAGAVLLGLGHSASHIPPRISLFTAIFSLLLGAIFVVLIMATVKGKPMVTPGFSFYLHNLGCIAGIIGSAMGWKKVAATAAGGMPGQPMPGQPMPGQPGSGQPMPGQAMPGQPMPGQPLPGAAPMDPAAQAPAMDPAAQAPAMDPAAQAPAPAACQTCGAAARWVPEHNRHYCDTCQRYV